MPIYLISEYLTFKLFPDKEAAEDFAEVLFHNSIPYFIEEDALMFDPSYANNPLNKDYAIKIPQEDFEKAHKAYENYFSSRLNEVDPDYYLFDFTNFELKQILARPDEWGSFDYALSEKILKERGIDISEAHKETLKSERHKVLAKPEKEGITNIIGYYLVSLVILPVGLIIGWTWGYSKKQLPNGQRVYAYDLNTNFHGRIIFKLSTILLIASVLWRVFTL